MPPGNGLCGVSSIKPFFTRDCSIHGRKCVSKFSVTDEVSPSPLGRGQT